MSNSEHTKMKVALPCMLCGMPVLQDADEQRVAREIRAVNSFDALVAALEPFAEAYGMLPLTHGPDDEPIADDEEVSIRCCGFQIDAAGKPITVADLKRIAAALSQAKDAS